jgi:hypothetical protein
LTKKQGEHSDGGPEFTSAGAPWKEAPELARSNVAWMDGRNGSAQSTLPSIEDVPVPDVFTRLPRPHVNRPRGSKAMIDAAGAKARLKAARAGAWLISSYTGRKWAKWPDGNVGWLPADVKLPPNLKVSAANSAPVCDMSETESVLFHQRGQNSRSVSLS